MNAPTVHMKSNQEQEFPLFAEMVNWFVFVAENAVDRC